MHGPSPPRQSRYDSAMRCCIGLGLVAVILGCAGDTKRATQSIRSAFDPAVAPPDTIPEALDYAADLQVDISEMAKLPVGVLYRDVAPGTGDPIVVGDSAEILIQGWLPNGQRVDSGVVALRVGAGDVIQGIDAALPGMLPGGRRKLVLSPGLAYGADGREGVPPNAVVVYDVELRAKLP